MHVGILQIETCDNKYENIHKLQKYLSRFLNKADIVILPEYFMYFREDMFKSPELIYNVSEDVYGDFVNMLRSICREYSIHVLATIIERCGNSIYNSAILIDNNGDILLKYRKIHLFDAYGFSESKIFSRGSIPSPVVKICDMHVACAICFDIRFPELFRVYMLNGADVVFIPAAWFRGDLKEDTLRFLAQARAHENGIFIVVCNQYSKLFTGRSIVVNPWGVVEIDLGIGEKYVEHRLDKSTLENFRNTIPIYKLRRTLSYSKIFL